MAAGPLFPSSMIPADNSGKAFPNVHVGAGGESAKDEGIGVMASLDADVAYDLRFQVPPALPSGTAKLRLLALSEAVGGDAKLNVLWASVAVGEDPSAAALNDEGLSTVTWGGSDNDKYLELKVTLDADTVVAGEVIAMQLAFKTASWTVANVTTWIPTVVWE